MRRYWNPAKDLPWLCLKSDNNYPPHGSIHAVPCHPERRERSRCSTLATLLSNEILRLRPQNDSFEASLTFH